MSVRHSTCTTSMVYHIPVVFLENGELQTIPYNALTTINQFPHLVHKISDKSNVPIYMYMLSLMAGSANACLKGHHT